MRVTGVIQAGGKSTRMGGRPKALMELGGRRIIDRVADVLRAVTDDLLIVTNTPDAYASLGLPMVPDVFPDHGSLGGIYSGLRAAPGDAAFTVACDMPFLMPEVARLVIDRAALADVVVPMSGGRLETLHACYAKSCLGPIERTAARRPAQDRGLLRRGASPRDPRGGGGALPVARPRLHEREHAGGAGGRAGALAALGDGARAR